MSDSSPAPAQTTFRDFGVDPAICDALAEVGITTPFPIQELTLPLALSGADIIGQARTGTGKTLGFGIPLLQRVDPDGGIQALVIVPTRELCLQVAEDLTQAGARKGVRVVAVYGGKAIEPQADAIRDGAAIVVGTPGRLLDLKGRGVLDLSNVTALVLDEADEMLDLGFLPDVEQLIEACAQQRQTLLFSATMPSAIVGLARRYMSKPTFLRADVEEVRIAPETKQYFFSCHRMDKPAVLARILQTPDRGLCVVFCRTKRMADILAEELRERDIKAAAIHSDLRQEARERALAKFRSGKTDVLVATEVAARGLDISDVTHVVNYDCPDDEKMYLHRIGRTGRAGAAGVAITFAVWNELPRLEMIRRELGIEEPIQEVFSTSELLDELFDLPPREERPKVPSPPQPRGARPGRSSRSGRSSSRDRGEEAAKDEARPASRSTRRRSRGQRSAEATPVEEVRAEPTVEAEEPAATRTRTRTRTRRRVTESADQPAEAVVETTATSEEEDGATTRVRRRRRRTTTTTGADTGETTTGRDRAAASTGARTGAPTEGSTDEKAPTDGGTSSDDGGERGGGRGRARTRTRTRQPTTSGAARAAARAADVTDSADASGGVATETSDEAPRAAEGDAAGNGGDGRSSRRRSSSRRGSRSSGSSRGNGRAPASSRGGRGGRRRDGGGRSSRPAVDASEARGEGRPRITRKLEIVHLP